jgi:hypothetical protein
MEHSEVQPVARLAPSLGVASIDADDDRFVVNFGTTRAPMLFTQNSSRQLEGEVATIGPNG